MPMSMKDFVSDLYRGLVGIVEDQQKIKIINDQDDLIYLSSELSLADAVLLLRKHQYNNIPLLDETAKEFEQYLTRVSEGSLNTGKTHQLNYDIHLNRFTRLVADKLSTELKKNKLALLIPSLKRTDFPEDKPLNHYVMSDDNTTMIDVMACLKELESHRLEDRKLYHTHPIGNVKQELSASELDRVINFNSEVNKYYHALLNKEVVEKRLSKFYNEANATMGKKPVNAKYGIAGYQKLKAEVYDDIEDRDALINKLSKLHTFSWLRFLNNMNITKLKSLNIGNHKSFYDAVVDTNNYTYTYKKQDRAVLLLFTFLYIKELEARPEEFTGLFRGWTGYSKKDKLNAALLLRNFLISNRKLSEFEDYLKENECQALYGPLTSSTLGSVTNQILICSKINYDDANQAIKSEQRVMMKR